MIEVRRPNTLGIEVRHIHEDWLSSWRDSIAESRLSDQIEKNQRVNQRIIDNILRKNGLPLVAEEEVDAHTLKICKTIIKYNPEFFNLCGLALMGSWLQRTIDPKKLSLFLDKFEQKQLQFAIHAGIDYPPFSDISIEPKLLADFIEMSGMRCVASWSAELPLSQSARIRLLLPPKYSVRDEKVAAIEADIAIQTVNAVTEFLNPRLEAG